MADAKDTAEPRPAGRRYTEPDADGNEIETPRFSLTGEDVPRYIPDPSKESSDKAREASMKITTLPHAIYAERVKIIAVLKAEGYNRDEIAEAMGMKRSGVDWCLREARKRGDLTQGMIEAAREIDEEAIPLAVENIVKALKDGNVDIAMELAKGRGLLRTYTSTKSEGAPGGAAGMAFQFNFVLQDGRPAPESAELAGKILGTGRT